MTRNEDRETKFNRAGSTGLPGSHAQAAVPHRIDDVLFHETAGDIQVRRYLVVGKTFQLAQEEGLAAQRRQFVQRQGQEVEALTLVLEYLGGRLGHTLLLVEDVQGLGLAHPAAAMLVDREIERRPVQERPRMLD